MRLKHYLTKNYQRGENMKYKIGDLEVDAVQWNGHNDNELKSIVSQHHSEDSIYFSERNYVNKYIIINIQTHQKNYRLNLTDYIIVTNSSIFTLSEREFNIMAVKIKEPEPKFKVGDAVYLIDDYMIDIKIQKVTLTAILKQPSKSRHSKEIFYEANGHFKVLNSHLLNNFESIAESKLFTLEETIEKLKEL